MRDEKVTALLVEQHMEWAAGVARRAHRVLPMVEVSDLVEVAVNALWQAAQAYRDDYRLAGHDRPVTFKEYARKWVYYSCLMAYRRRRFWNCTGVELNSTHAARGTSPDQASQEVEADLLLRRVIRGLPTMQRRIIRGHYRDQRTLVECARRLRISHTWAKIQHGRALKALRAGLEERGIRKVGDCL